MKAMEDKSAQEPQPNTHTSRVTPYAAVILRLFQGVVYQEDTALWQMLQTYRLAVLDYFARIGIEVRLHEGEGFAFLSQPEAGSEDGGPDRSDRPDLPRLIRRIPLSYDVTLGCVLLRERLLLFENAHPDAQRLVLTLEELRDLLSPFHAERQDEVKRTNRLDQVVHQLERLGFLKALKNADPPAYEVRRLLKAKLGAEELASIQERLEEWRNREAEGRESRRGTGRNRKAPSEIPGDEMERGSHGPA